MAHSRRGVHNTLPTNHLRLYAYLYQLRRGRAARYARGLGDLPAWIALEDLRFEVGHQLADQLRPQFAHRDLWGEPVIEMNRLIPLLETIAENLPT
jgi:hypothetical protein